MTTKKEKKISEKVYKVDFKVSTFIWWKKYFWIETISKDIYKEVSKLEYFINNWDIVLL